MPKSITIRDVPEKTGRALAARAAAAGQSLQSWLRAQLIELAHRPSPEEWVARVRERVERTGSEVDAETILRHRDSGRR